LCSISIMLATPREGDYEGKSSPVRDTARMAA